MAASFWLPYQPMLPLQILIQNILDDLSQSAIPFDSVDEHTVAAPVQWSIMGIIRFMLVFGPTSSLFDIATFSINWFHWRFRDVGDDAGVAIAQIHWFIEGSITQTLVVFILRTDLVPFI
jgi:Mg2+-importing ATPase